MEVRSIPEGWVSIERGFGSVEFVVNFDLLGFQDSDLDYSKSVSQISLGEIVHELFVLRPLIPREAQDHFLISQ